MNPEINAPLAPAPVSVAAPKTPAQVPPNVTAQPATSAKVRPQRPGKKQIIPATAAKP